jgi:ADP-ribosylglycohydrolase
MLEEIMKKAWQLDREMRLSAVPVDRRSINLNYMENVNVFQDEDTLFRTLWGSSVPGSGAPEVAYIAMVQSMHNKGFDVGEAERILEEALVLRDLKDWALLKIKTEELLSALFAAPARLHHPYHQYENPAAWEEVLEAMHPEAAQPKPRIDPGKLEGQIYNGWVGQLAGGSFGTALEGYTGEAIQHVYGRIEDYVAEPETTNDDVVYELVFLDVFERMGRDLTSIELGKEWVRQIPFGWSAELVALENMKKGLLPPESGEYHNPYSDWIGVQMRTMICGMLAAGQPLEAARLAHLDGVVSHSANGVYGGMYAAAATSLAFVRDDPRTILKESLKYIPQKSEYADVVRLCLGVVAENGPQKAWAVLDQKYEEYNWIHAYPNLAAVIVSLWYCEGDMTRAFSLLAQAGMDVDCNAGLVGNVLGIMNPVPAKWAEPITRADVLETYLPDYPRVSIRKLSERTYKAGLRLAKQ